MRKAAIQVSIGFLIVMVISALVMIFMMGWLSNLFPQLTQISKYATAQAQQQMMNEFAKGGESVLATIPTQQSFAPGSLVPFKIGIRKTAAVDDMKAFSVCMGNYESITCTATPTDSGLVQPYNGKAIGFVLPPPQIINNRGEIALSDGKMQIDSTVTAGLYGFRIYVCAYPGVQTNMQCQGLSDPHYYGKYDFIIEVK